ncbi:MAG: hypothetical protein MI974_31150 [Chitinophagales bacterium]|nr:hypothetical protein [Chitinophagales bacterium]
MKTTIIILFLALNFSYSQNILDHFEIKEIQQIEISFAPNMDVDAPENSVVKSVDDPVFLDTIKLILSNLPAKGTIFKDFPRSIPTWRIVVIDQDNESHRLIFYGIKLRTPIGIPGTYYSGQQKIGDLEKRLYLAIRSQMIGDWYHCN